MPQLGGRRERSRARWCGPGPRRVRPARRGSAGGSSGRPVPDVIRRTWPVDSRLPPGRSGAGPPRPTGGGAVGRRSRPLRRRPAAERAERAELVRLRREGRQLKLERDTLSRAPAGSPARPRGAAPRVFGFVSANQAIFPVAAALARARRVQGRLPRLAAAPPPPSVRARADLALPGRTRAIHAAPRRRPPIRFRAGSAPPARTGGRGCRASPSSRPPRASSTAPSRPTPGAAGSPVGRWPTARAPSPSPTRSGWCSASPGRGAPPATPTRAARAPRWPAACAARGPAGVRPVDRLGRGRLRQRHGRTCQDLDPRRRRPAEVERDSDGGPLAEHEVGKLLLTVEGIGPRTAPRAVAAPRRAAPHRVAANLPRRPARSRQAGQARPRRRRAQAAPRRPRRRQEPQAVHDRSRRRAGRKQKAFVRLTYLVGVLSSPVTGDGYAHLQPFGTPPSR